MSPAIWLLKKKKWPILPLKGKSSSLLGKWLRDEVMQKLTLPIEPLEIISSCLLCPTQRKYTGRMKRGEDHGTSRLFFTERRRASWWQNGTSAQISRLSIQRSPRDASAPAPPGMAGAGGGRRARERQRTSTQPRSTPAGLALTLKAYA